MKITLHIGLIGCSAQALATKLSRQANGSNSVAPAHSEMSKSFVKAFYTGPQALQGWSASLPPTRHLHIFAPKLTQVIWPAHHIAQNIETLRALGHDLDLRAVIDSPQAIAARLYAQQILAGRTAPLTSDFTAPREGIASEQLPKALELAPRILPWCAAHPIDFSLYAPSSDHRPLSDETLERLRQINLMRARLKQTEQSGYAALPMASLHQLAQIDGPALDPDHWGPVVARLAASWAPLRPYLPDHLIQYVFAPCSPQIWQPPATTRGFRPSQYLVAAAGLERDRLAATKEEKIRDIGKAVLHKISNIRRPEIEAGFTGQLPTWAKPTLYELMESGKFAFDRPIERPSTEFPLTSKPFKGSLIITCMKNEGPYLLDWLAFHRSIGFENFIIYANDCSDGTDDMLKRLDELGVVNYRPNNDFGPKGPQLDALQAVLNEPIYQDATVTCHIDADEFINIQCGDGTLQALHAASAGASHVALSWRMFGHDGQIEIPTEPIFALNQRAAPSVCPLPHYIHGIKTLSFQPHLYDTLGAHRPKGLPQVNRKSVKWINGSGQDVTARYRDTNWRSNQKTKGYDLVQLNHYALRSRDGYFVKRARGRALHIGDQIDHSYWMRMDWNDVPEPSILRHAPRFDQYKAQLLADHRLDTLHKQAIIWHSELALKLKRDPDFVGEIQILDQPNLSATERMAYCLAYETQQGQDRQDR